MGAGAADSIHEDTRRPRAVLIARLKPIAYFIVTAEARAAWSLELDLGIV
jgi:hypothetical protein